MQPASVESYPLEIRPYERRDLSAARSLTFYNYHTHSQLDWQTVEDYLHAPPKRIWVAYRHHELVGIIATSDPLDGSVWLRLLSAKDVPAPNEILWQLWRTATDYLRAEGVTQVGVLLMRDWLLDFLLAWGFVRHEQIVTLRRYSRSAPPPVPQAEHVRIVPIERAHFETVRAIDNAAFMRPWQLSLGEIYLGVRIATHATLALYQGEPVGYQISTTYGFNGHLARLAVLPTQQGRGIGKQLLGELLAYFHHQHIWSVTVNTQESNIHSQRLYLQYGFIRNGYDLPMWLCALNP